MNSLPPRQKNIAPDELKAWRKKIAESGGTLSLVTGSFALWQPGNLAAIREAARQASHVCIIVHPPTPERYGGTGPTTPENYGKAGPASQNAARPNLAARLEMAAGLRAISAVTTCAPGEAEQVLTNLQPFTLVDCLKQKAPGAIASTARKLADHIVDLAPVAGCFTADIQKAIRESRTPIPVPDAVMGPQPDRRALDRFLSSGTPARPLVTVNGCFDVLHLGHVRMLEQARKLGARLMVLVNDDDSVRDYKGAARPIFPIRFRLHALNALEAVAMAYPFAGDNPLPLLATIRPDIHVKGGSFEETRVRDERRLLESWGGRLETIPLVKGYSTSAVVKSIAQKSTTDDRRQTTEST